MCPIVLLSGVSVRQIAEGVFDMPPDTLKQQISLAFGKALPDLNAPGSSNHSESLRSQSNRSSYQPCAVMY